MTREVEIEPDEPADILSDLNALATYYPETMFPPWPQGQSRDAIAGTALRLIAGPVAERAMVEIQTLRNQVADLDLLRTELDAAGVDPCEGQPVTARVRWLMDELERVKGDAARWRFARTIFSFEDIERAAYECRGTWQFKPNEEESLKTDAAVDAEIEKAERKAVAP